jgi:hypothetical protein
MMKFASSEPLRPAEIFIKAGRFKRLRFGTIFKALACLFGLR